ncbi:hypothetical protein [methane-oxidizing endosymbiont of Gigantopelta aegis]|uniref:hypothetical protein n=1 Tax=methane-oxidizing endosymbiont of Gigantopelta aegis TaxID=2794938 RepID=UPI0018DC148D|nr:hypothetical protein [methane-oxidizing endosymbiont of Gigantopelta aegis]
MDVAQACKIIIQADVTRWLFNFISMIPRFTITEKEKAISGLSLIDTETTENTENETVQQG